MLKGVDVSHWDSGLQLDGSIDFCIAKITQGTSWVDGTFGAWMIQAHRLGIRLGAYHFADGQNPRDEAQFFWSMVKDLDSIVPVLDFEISTDNDVAWCEKFMERFHELSNHYPMLYISASLCKLFDNSWIPDYCALWVAGYPQPAYDDWISRECPYNVGKWGRPDIWQFTSELSYNGHKVDANLAYMGELGFDALTMGADMTLQELMNAKVHTSYGDLTVRDIISWTYAYTRDMQPVVFDLQKRVKELEKKVDNDR